MTNSTLPMRRPQYRDRPRFCGTCGSCLIGTVDPYTGDILVEVEVHAIPDDINDPMVIHVHDGGRHDQ